MKFRFQMALFVIAFGDAGGVDVRNRDANALKKINNAAQNDFISYATVNWEQGNGIYPSVFR